MGLRFGFGTNGLGDNRLPDALRLLADLGYQGVALTLDTGHLDPYGEDLGRDLPRIARLLDELELGVVIETGARYLLDPRRKHYPTLISEGGERRVDFLERAVRIGAELGAEAVSFWSGAAPADEPVTESALWERLVRGCERVMTAAERHGVRLCLEPEPGMLVQTIAGYERLAAEFGTRRTLGLTLDIGHCRCLEELSVPDCVRRAGERLFNVQIEDMRRGVHEHLEFGRGEIDFPPALAALEEIGYPGLVSVELPRHGHDGPGAARRSIEFLRAAEAAALAETAA
jgi:L-ribulose-5-phosphate 3-epimerase